jgi:WD40 repeat protein
LVRINNFVVAFSEDFVAHGSSVNCLALGHKSGRVLVTGGDDKKVNLWAVGKHGCIMVCSYHYLYYNIVTLAD